jgi:hypothetical protein
MAEDWETAAYNKRRDEVLAQDNLPAFIVFAAAHGTRFSNQHVAEIAMHKARTAIPTLPAELRTRSKKWLLAQGYEAWGDGDVAGLASAVGAGS